MKGTKINVVVKKSAQLKDVVAAQSAMICRIGLVTSHTPATFAINAWQHFQDPEN
jgi:hypothetical protein